MNENEIGRIAAAINQLRPDWPTASLVSLISQRLSERPRRDVAVALTWVACDSQTLTPARVVEAGPWWKAATVETPDAGGRRPPHKHEECAKHAGEYRLSCRGCGADRKAALVERQAAVADQWVAGRLTREEAITEMRRMAADARQQTARDAAPAVEEEA